MNPIKGSSRMQIASADLREVWKRLAEQGEVAAEFSDYFSGTNSNKYFFGKKIDGAFFRVGSAMQGCRE